MGEAKRRGTFEERRDEAIKNEHTKSGWWRDYGGLSKRGLRLAYRKYKEELAKNERLKNADDQEHITEEQIIADNG